MQKNSNKNYIVRQTCRGLITYIYFVKAKNEEEAREKFDNGEYDDSMVEDTEVDEVIEENIEESHIDII